MEELCRIIAKESQCPSCLKEFQEPKVLSCSHTLCLQCVKRLTIQEAECVFKVRCPTCKVETALPKEGSPGIPTNAAIVSLLSAVHTFKVEHGLEKEVGLWKFKVNEIDLPSKDCANGMAATQDNRIGLVDRFGGIHLYSPSGSRETILPGVEKIQGVVFFKTGRFAVLFSDNNVRLYNSSSQCLDVRFKTMSIEDGGCSVLTGDNKGDVYVGYNGMANSRIQIFTQEGGKQTGEIPCVGFKAKKLLAMASKDLLVADICYKNGNVRSSKVILIDETGREIWSTEREGVQVQMTNGQDDTIMMSWLRSESANDIGLLTIEQYSKDMKDMKTLISDYEVVTSTCPSYHLQQFSSGELAFCTANNLYILTRIA
ncbi:uncharacterized protein LOC115929961 [Strongylocentrotus purpuratus]|uniref:RING-type domain-containing protein n=1 Tax=Strongylocentrotus purpuratus TaxID=7668 RepID=A0A7M7PT25_STRPU|nr:uncharacterized protein LOC115929961 [Strongylocentrotus purpuratus]